MPRGHVRLDAEMKRGNLGPSRVEPFAERLRRLREARGWSQNELAEVADLAPAALSRVLSGERKLRMEHAIALAWALELTLTELLAGTTAAGIVLEWIPRARFEDSERARTEALRERDVARTDAAARGAEVVSLERSLATLHERLDAREREHAGHRIEVETARAQRHELLRLRQQAAALEAQVERLQTEGQALRTGSERASREAAEYRRRWEETCARSHELQADLSDMQGGTLAAGALGLFLGAVLRGETPAP